MARLNPKVTVLIPVYNRERFVDEAIRSVMEQDFDDFELLLVEGGSTDRTPEVLEMWKKRDRRVVVVTTPTREGISAALNLGLAHARGKYVARLDSDDLMMPRRLAEQAAVLDAHSEVVLVSCAYDIVDLAGNRLGTWKRDEPPEVTAFLLHFFNVIGGHGQVMFRLAAALEEGGYARKLSEDYDLWVRLRRRGRIETLPFVGMAKRTHANQALVQSLERWDLRHATWSGSHATSVRTISKRQSGPRTAGMCTEKNRPAVVYRRAELRPARSSARSDEVPRACGELARHSTSHRHCLTDHGLMTEKRFPKEQRLRPRKLPTSTKRLPS